jgi:hypothetical protein
MLMDKAAKHIVSALLIQDLLFSEFMRNSTNRAAIYGGVMTLKGIPRQNSARREILGGAKLTVQLVPRICV